jgi:PhzF family phenazine biosynthesis protein
MAESTAAPVDYYVVDAFTSEAFRGNPAAVFVLREERDSAWMQLVASEMNLSDTAFVADHVDSEGIRSLRWFTPETEVDLCGHATLAAARVLGGEQRFRTRSGILSCNANDDGRVSMDFPADPATPLSQELYDDLRAALPGVDIAVAGKGKADTLVMTNSVNEVQDVEPDLTAMLKLETRGVIVTAPHDGEEADFVSRCFLPSIGVDEDPVTGSAHCTLASWWGPRLGRDELVGRQLSERGGVVRVRLSGDRVHLIGDAVIVSQGRLLY